LVFGVLVDIGLGAGGQPQRVRRVFPMMPAAHVPR
jgi:hypothetical protein